MDSSSEGVKYIAEGTYGCVFTSKISCQNEIEDENKGDKKYVSKVSVESSDTSTVKEIAFGKVIITQIANYDYYFAPILSSCPVDIGVINEEEIEKCNVVQNNKDKNYVSNTLKYVGKNTILDHFDLLPDNKRKKLILESHIHLTKALDKLLSLDDPIIHFDLKDANIIFNDTFNVPNIIDFGLSFTREELLSASQKTEILDSIFYAYADGYFVWNIEIVLICYISQKIVMEQDVSTKELMYPYLEKLNEIVDTFVKASYIFQDDDEKRLFIEGTNMFLELFRNKPIHILIDALIGNWKSWDNYSIAMVFFSFIKNNTETDVCLINYRQLLKNILLSPAGASRLQPIDTMNAIIELSRIK